jgi:hypothetical protein
MIARPEPIEPAPSAHDEAAMLRRILEAVERDTHKRWVEITSAVVLSLATFGSAWCAYQSTLWGGVQTFRLAAATKAGRQSSEATVVAMQGRAADASMLISFLEAESRGDERMQTILRQRFRPEMKVAVEAWLKLDPFNNSAAPPSPFKMPEYQQPELAEAKRQNDLFDLEYAHAQHANQTSDTYVLLTVLFSSVLFFAGIGGTFNSQNLRVAALAISIALFAITVVAVGTMPICRE